MNEKIKKRDKGHKPGIKSQGPYEREVTGFKFLGLPYKEFVYLQRGVGNQTARQIIRSRLFNYNSLHGHLNKSLEKIGRVSGREKTYFKLNKNPVTWISIQRQSPDGSATTTLDTEESGGYRAPIPPIIWGFVAGRGAFFSTRAGATLESIALYVYGDVSQASRMASASGLDPREPLPAGFRIDPTGAPFTERARNSLQRALNQGTIIRYDTGEAPEIEGGQMYRIDLPSGQVEVTEGQFKGLLRGIRTVLLRKIRYLQGLAQDLNALRNRHVARSNNLVRFICDRVGGAELPEENFMAPVIERCQNNARILASLDVTDVLAASRQLQEVSNSVLETSEQYNRLSRRWKEYIRATISGGETSVTVLEWTRDISFATAAALGTAVVAPIAIGAAGVVATSASGLAITAGAGGVVSGTAALVRETATQVSEVGHGLREEVDIGQIFSQAGAEAITGFVGALMGGALAGRFVSFFGRYIANISDDVLMSLSQRFGREITREFIFACAQRMSDFGAGVLASPITTAIGTAIDFFRGTSPPPTMDQFLDRIAREMTRGAILQLVIGAFVQGAARRLPTTRGETSARAVTSPVETEEPTIRIRRPGLEEEVTTRYRRPGFEEEVTSVWRPGEEQTRTYRRGGFEEESTRIWRPEEQQIRRYRPSAFEEETTGVWRPEERRSRMEIEEAEPTIVEAPVLRGEARPMSAREIQEFWLRAFRREPIVSPENVEYVSDQLTFEFAYRNAGGVEELPIAFVDPESGRIWINTQAEDFLTLFHETIHQYAISTGGRNRFVRRCGTFMEEGITEWITRRHLGPHPHAHPYDPHVRLIDNMILKGGVTPDAILTAYMDGDLTPMRAQLERRFNGDRLLVDRFLDEVRDGNIEVAEWILETGREPPAF